MARNYEEYELDKIRKWDYKDPLGLFQYIQDLWSYKNYIEIKKLKRGDHRITLCTGGWSGHEDIICAIHENIIIQSMYWYKSIVGGEHVYYIGSSKNV